MGLDMYLTATRYVGGWDHSSQADRDLYTTLTKLLSITPDSGSPSCDVKFNIGYWRKANAIHKWFVDNTQNGIDDNGEPSSVSTDQLQALRTLCQKVLDGIELVPAKIDAGTQYSAGVVTQLTADGERITNQAFAEELLPTQGGFFFGNTDYDNRYVQNLRDTLTIIDKALALGDDWTFEYQSSW